MKKRVPGPPSPLKTPAGQPGEELKIIYGANADIRKVLLQFNVAAARLVLDPDAADHMATQLRHYAQLARGRVQ